VKAILEHMINNKLLPENVKQAPKNIYEDMSREGRKELFAKGDRFVLIIDEINRGDVSKVFGELITLLEEDKRLGEDNEIVVELPFSGEKFGVPPNLSIIGTMNTADNSIAHIDVALRRRFVFKEMVPDFQLDDLREHISSLECEDQVNETVKALQVINDRICRRKEIGREKQIGHCFLFSVYSEQDLVDMWIEKILPLLQEYAFGDIQVVKSLLGIDEFIDEYRGFEYKKIRSAFPGFIEAILNGYNS